jgi:hypothetical protein
MTTRKPTAPVAQIPHSWTFATWPKDVYPNDGKRGRLVCRANKTALVAEGALTRIGREVVVLGHGYARFLVKQAGKVLDFDVPANRPEHAAKRNNGAAHSRR